MAMNVGPGTRAAIPTVMVEINTTPLIDVMLVLLIMLIITIPIQLHSVTLDAPTVVRKPPPEPPPAVAVEVDADGVVRWNGEALPAARRSTSGCAAAAVPDAPELHLRPDPAAAYKHVAAVLAAAQRQGVTRLGIVGGTAPGPEAPCAAGRPPRGQKKPPSGGFCGAPGREPQRPPSSARASLARWVISSTLPVPEIFA